jgi:hypothetical protein
MPVVILRFVQLKNVGLLVQYVDPFEWVPCYHSLSHIVAVNGEGDFQIWRLAAVV